MLDLIRYRRDEEHTARFILQFKVGRIVSDESCEADNQRNSAQGEDADEGQLLLLAERDVLEQKEWIEEGCVDC